MTPEQFTYWLQGFMEIANPEKLTKKEVQIIKDHLAQVFDKQTPYRTTTTIGTDTEVVLATIYEDDTTKPLDLKTTLVC